MKKLRTLCTFLDLNKVEFAVKENENFSQMSI